MEHFKLWALIGVGIVLAAIVYRLFVGKRFGTDLTAYVDEEAQEDLFEYQVKDLSNEEIGTFYERYIGYLYESDGYKVRYNGALNGVNDLGRDLIVSNEEKVLIVQTKRWAKRKFIPITHIHQLYGSMMHYKLEMGEDDRSVKAIFFTSANFDSEAKKAASLLGVQLVVQSLDQSYPMVKCHNNRNGDKYYFIPTDPEYDQISIDIKNGDCFVARVSEAVSKGYIRAHRRFRAA